jgi:molybdopterin-containing oxidoreductase family iron-sulfur binding subunit
MPKYGMVIDLDNCYGCRACMVACKVENNTPESHFWMYVFRLETGEYPNSEVKFLPRPCMHCEDAPCVTVCPVSARYYEEGGFVATDWDKCIGCRYCAIACPYGVNNFNWKDPEKNQYLDWDDPDLEPVTGGALPYANPDLEGRYGSQNRKIAGSNHQHGVMEKCTFCIHRVEKGLQPACVANCPAFALHFGDLDDPNSNVSRLLEQKAYFHLLEETGTHPKVHYVGGAPPTEDDRQIEIVRGE